MGTGSFIGRGVINWKPPVTGLVHSWKYRKSFTKLSEKIRGRRLQFAGHGQGRGDELASKLFTMTT